ncbi:MAG: hypothetical protein JWO38_4492 [Gemmataceae bacterium]|nr:hypothetical protein [Gemmataceae bacterium]
MAVVVRCPGCRGASQVGPEALGLLVVCPRCSDPFLAVEEATPVAPSPSPAAKSLARGTPPRPPAPARGRPVEPAARRRGWAEPVAPPPDTAQPASRQLRPGQSDAPGQAPADSHDPLAGHAGGLPISVLIGLALLPFAIPLLWLIGPHVLGQQPALSLAAPASLALSASVLCLAVVYTVDWSPATRVKGVLMLVGLAYFAGLSLFFLKKDMVDRAKEMFGPERDWQYFSPQDKTYRVKLPESPTQVPLEQPMLGWKLTCYKSSHKGLTGVVVFVVGAGLDKDAKPVPQEDDAKWLDDVKKALCASTGGGADNWRPVKHPHPGWECGIHLPNGNMIRTVRVYRVAGKIYYLAAEGQDLDPDDDLTRLFFDSFLVTPLKQ